ncbi:MAG: RNA-binding protein, partial [Sediminibacterium sp.]|nr:RNA-binding protein [Sediminibacterium sp.]
MLRSYLSGSNVKFFAIVPAFFAFVLLTSCSKPTLFEQIPSSKSGIHFSNVIAETDSINVLDFENVYNGGGVGIGDFNNDGLQDIYFSGNLVSNRLYVNKGSFSFSDITSSAGVAGDGKWCRGVSVVDINNDGWQDIYVCATLLKDPAKREHLLYINQGLDKSGNPFFINQAKEYGLALTTHGTMAAFFDYDNDGDLDVYLANNEIVKNDYPNRFRPVLKDGSHPNSDQLLRNDYNAELHHPVFTNVSKEAGILIEGYAHAVTIADFNRDGWKDIYVSNDYLSSDLLWINNKNGTFTDQLSVYFKHTSANAMGNDVVDINNDGLSDVIALDMNPEDNYRKKMMLNPNSYQTYQNLEYFNYHFQYVRNTLQLNQGPRVLENDTIGAPVFSDVSFFTGVAETDWSWTPLVADYDNDGNRDIIITNGFPKDVTDHDFVAFRNTSYAVATKKQLLSQIPEVKIHNYAYKNNGNLQFTNVTENWGLTQPSFSNGAVYADLDNDGDLDMVVNNINDEAGLYKNTLLDKKKEGNNYLQIKLQGDSLNLQGLGTWMDAFLPGGKRISLEYTPYRGYLSSVDPIAHIGLGNSNQIDSLVITWPNGYQQKLMNVKANQRLRITQSNAKPATQPVVPLLATDAIFRNITHQAGIEFVQQEKDFIDFNIQKLIPHKFSEYGPALAVGDINGDGIEDMVVGGSFSFSAQLFFQQKDGRFVQKALIANADINTKRWEDEGMILFDADSDGDLDLYIASGG